MKRILSLLLVLVLAFSVVACNNNNNENNNANNAGNNENNVMTDNNAGSTDDTETPVGDNDNDATITVQAETDWLPYYEAAKARVEAMYPKATIEIMEIPSFDNLDVLDATDVTNVDVPDVFAIPADRLAGLAQNEALAGLDSLTMANAVGGFSDFDGGLGGNLKMNGDYLAFPMNIETLIIFANTANAADKGIDLTQTIEFTELGHEDMLVPVFNAWFGVALTNSANVELLGQDGDTFFSDLVKDFSELNADQQALFTALYDFWKMQDEAGTDAWDSSATWGYMDAEFATGGNNVLRLEGPWSTGGLSDMAGSGADLEILPITQVTINGNPLAHWKGGWGLAVNARIEEDADKMDLASAMIQEIMNPDYAVDMFKAAGKIMPNVEASVYADSDLSETDKKVIAAVFESYADAPNRPLFKEWGSVWTTWENSVLSWSALKPASVEDAYKEVQAAFKAMMMNY